MKPVDVVELHAQILAVWPARLVDALQRESVPVIAESLPPEMTLPEAVAIVREFSRRGSPFPPSWPEIAERWQAHKGGVADDPEIIAGTWLAEVYREVGQGGGCFYRPMPAFSDPIIAAAVRQAAGGWREWGATTNGGPGAEGEAFTRNLIPERDARFRKAVVAMLAHRRRTGDDLPAIVGGERRPELERGRNLQRLGDGT